MKKLLLILMLATAGGVRAQVVDSVAHDTTYPTPYLFVRIKFPNPHFSLEQKGNFINAGSGVRYPPGATNYYDYALYSIDLWFSECKTVDDADSAIEVLLPGYPIGRYNRQLMYYVYLNRDTNTVDSNCFLTNTFLPMDTFVYCSDTVVCKAEAYRKQQISIPDVARPEDAALFPNPVSDLLYIRSTSPVEAIQLFSAEGRLALAVNYPSGSVSVSHLPPGLYVAVLRTKHGSLRKKLIVQH